MEATTLQPLKIDRTKLKTVRNYAVQCGVTTTQVYNWIKAKKVEKVEKQAKKEGVMVPLNAVGEINNTNYVLIVENGKLKLSEVVVAEETNNYARVTSGLATGSKVVARFDYELENNQKVTIN